MSELLKINSGSYWDSRFSNDWETQGGPQQTRFFTRLAIENLPTWLLDQARRQNLTLADWGCAQGDGTDIWSNYLESSQLVGIDISEVAIEQANFRYPSVHFSAENWLDPEVLSHKTYDIIFSSNTLEHFHQPYEVLKSLIARAKKAVVLALPYRELDRIDEHFYTFLPNNVPIDLDNDFQLVWSRVIDCKRIPNTYWSGDQVLLVYIERSWLKSLKLTLNDCKVETNDPASINASLTQEVAIRDAQVTTLTQEIAVRETKIANLSQEVAIRDAQVTTLTLEVSARDIQIATLTQARTESDGRVINLSHELDDKRRQLDDLVSSTIWRTTRPIRMMKRMYSAFTNDSERYRILKDLYWKLPEFLRLRLSRQRHKYVSRNFHLSNEKLPKGGILDPDYNSSKSVPNWILTANSSQKIAIIPCGFEFDELVNQRPINAAKYFSEQGYLVLFIAWQWSRGESLSKGCGEVWPGIYQVPLFDLVDNVSALPNKQDDAIFLLSLPAKIFVDLAPFLRSRGYSIIYDVMDEWEEFHKSGQAPWFDRDVELNLVLQSDVVSAVAPELVRKFSNIRTDIQLIGNGYTPEMLGTFCRSIAGTGSRKSNTVGYFGHLTDAWFDWSLLFELADAHTDHQFDLIGYGEPAWVRGRIAQSENINLIGKIHPKELHEHVRHWQFGIIPFIEGKLAQAVDPIKIYEYLYFGLSTFVTGIEHLQSYPGVSFSNRTNALDEFNKFLKAPTLANEDLDDFLRDTTWNARFSHLLSYVSKNRALGDLYVH